MSGRTHTICLSLMIFVAAAFTVEAADEHVLKFERRNFIKYDTKKTYLSSTKSELDTVTWERTLDKTENLQVRMNITVDKALTNVDIENLCNISESKTGTFSDWNSVAEHILTIIFVHTSKCPVEKGTCDVIPKEIELPNIKVPGDLLGPKKNVTLGFTLRSDDSNLLSFTYNGKVVK